MWCNDNSSNSSVAAVDRWDDGSSHLCVVRVAEGLTTGHRRVSVVVVAAEGAVVEEVAVDVVRRLCVVVAIAVHVVGHAVRCGVAVAATVRIVRAS